MGIYIGPHTSSLLRLPPTLPIPPLQVVTKHQADLPVLCGCFPLAILHLVVYISPRHSLTLSQLTLPPPHVLKSILYVCVFIPVLPVEFFLNPQEESLLLALYYLTITNSCRKRSLDYQFQRQYMSISLSSAFSYLVIAFDSIKKKTLIFSALVLEGVGG